MWHQLSKINNAEVDFNKLAHTFTVHVYLILDYLKHHVLNYFDNLYKKTT